MITQENMVFAIASGLSGFGGLLRCMTCGTERPLGNVGHRLSAGWPKHCGYTMRWVTQGQLDEETGTALASLEPK